MQVSEIEHFSSVMRERNEVVSGSLTEIMSRFELLLSVSGELRFLCDGECRN
jgi:hypothetical protein